MLSHFEINILMALQYYGQKLFCVDFIETFYPVFISSWIARCSYSSHIFEIQAIWQRLLFLEGGHFATFEILIPCFETATVRVEH